MNAQERVEALYALSPSQTGMWLQSQTDRGASLFLEQAAFCLRGPLQRGALERSLQWVVDRHAALRSAILSKGREPVRAVLRHLPVVIGDACARGDDEDAALAMLMDRERVRGFALNRPPLIRFAVLRIDDERAWLVLSFHHIILDGWSLAVLWSEADARYAAEIAGTSVALPPAPHDREFAAWLSARSETASEEFWRARLAGFTAPNRLAPAPAPVASAEVLEVEHGMTRAAGMALTAAAQAARVSPAVIIEVLWAVLVAGRTRTSDVAFAATVSGRPADVPGIERMVGCFINTVPIRMRFENDVTLRQCVVDHQRERAEQQEFEYCAAGQIHSWSEVAANQPLCQSLIVYENVSTPVRASDGSPAAAADPSADRARVHGARTTYPLTLLVSPGLEPHVRVIYQPACFSQAVARDFAIELERLILASPGWLDRPVRSLCETVAFAPVLTELQGASPARSPLVAPRSRLEYQLAAIWCELFKRPNISVLDDFFSLGGHSLLALQMAERVRAALGIELPLHALIAGPTIEKLALACAARSGGEEGVLIPIAAGGAGMPVFCIHPLGGHVLCYAALGRHLSGRHPVWGLQAKGLQSGESPAATWDDIVDHHWALLVEARGRADRRVDEIALVGYSYGGYIAMELAARAYREGATRITVFLLDVPHPSVVPDAMRHPDAATLLHALFGETLGLDLPTLQRMPGDTLLRAVYDCAVRQHVLPPDADLDRLARALAVAQAHSRLEPPRTRYGFRASLLRARDGATRISTLPDLGWQQVTDELTVEWVDGRHETMLEAQHAGDLAAHIVDALAIVPSR